MAPLCKVFLVNDYEDDEDVTSGPHSILFGIQDLVTKDLQRIDKTYERNETVILNEEPNKSCEDCSKSKKLLRSNTYEALKDTTISSNKTISNDKIENIAVNLTFPVNNIISNTFNLENDACLNQNNFPDIVNSTRIVVTDRSNDSLNISNLEDNNQTVILNNPLNRNKRELRTQDVFENINDGSYILENAESDDSNESLNKNNKNNSNEEVNRTFVQPCGLAESNATKKRISDELGFERPMSFPSSKIKPLRLSDEFTSPPLNTITLTHSTPVRISDIDVESSPRRRVRASTATPNQGLEDDGSKRDSLEFEESLGILTPEQIADVTGFTGSRTPSSENIKSLMHDLQSLTKFHCDVKSAELGSPNLVDCSLKDLSLGIIDEHVLSNLTMKSDTTMNMELPLDSVENQNQSKDYTFTRLEQTPSPEDLPLDPTPVIETEAKTEPTKSKTSSFITSITSITSLDTGYQGDGEMSRPASRGPDHSPLTRRPLQRPQPRRPDPMTDSDFYTESDADNHEDHPVRGGRLARVIDGTLYGVDPQAAADIYVNNRENMDSSGIFTDIEGNTRADELSSAENENRGENLYTSPSPSDTSSKTISNDSQNNAPGVLNRTATTAESNKELSNNNISVEVPVKHKSPTPSSTASSPISVRSPRHISRDDLAKKYKTPKRNVSSKVKSVLEINNLQDTRATSRTITPKKTVGRWDAVMNKISKSSAEKPNLKDIKSKVFSTQTVPVIRQVSSSRTPTTKMRRNRTRGEASSSKTNESLHSSASDLSSASPAKRTGSGKKKSDVVRVTQVLTASKLSPKSTPKINNTSLENKKNGGTAVTANNDNKLATRRPLFTPKEKKQTSVTHNKDCGRAPVKGGRVSPGTRPPQQNRVSQTPSPKTAEALAILVQHLVFNLDAFQTPSLKNQLEKAQQACRQLEETLLQTQLDNVKFREEERAQHEQEIEDLNEQHKNTIAQLNHHHSQVEHHLLTEHENQKQELILAHNEQLLKLREECNKLQKTHEQTLEILREENDSILEEIDDKKVIIEKLQASKGDIEKQEKEYKTREFKLKQELAAVAEEITHLKEENLKIIHFAAEGKENRLQIAEVESLRAVLELKQNEVAELRRNLAEASQKEELLRSSLERISLLTARCEDLQSQLEHKSEYEHQLVSDNKVLQESLKKEFNHSKRLTQYNEELQWKLKQNKEVVTRVLEQAEETAFNRSMLSASLNERHTASKQLERTMSVREHSNKTYTEGMNRCRKSKNSYNLDEDITPPSSPKVKGVVEKSDSVSYVLEMEESPEMIANRIVRRSFRNSISAKTTPTKSPANKRPRMKNNPLSLSASTGAIMPSLNRTNHITSRSLSVRNGNDSSHSDDVFIWNVVTSTPQSHKLDETFCLQNNSLKLEHDIDLDDNYNDDIKIPTLPSEIGRKDDLHSLPIPKHLAGEAMISESNSDDESTASSSSGQL